MKRTILAITLVLTLVSSARAQTYPTCAQLPLLACVAGDAYTGTHDFGDVTALEIKNQADCSSVTGEGQICWDSDGDALCVGDGTSSCISIGAGSMTDFDVAGDDNGTVTISDGDTLSIDGDASGIDTDCDTPDTCTLSFDPTEVTTVTWAAGASASETWTWNVSTGTDPTITFGDGMITVGQDFTISGDDLYMATNTDGFVLVADGTNFNPVDMSGDINITNTGATEIQDNTVSGDKIEMGSDATGDILYYTAGGDYTRLAIGGANEVLRVSSGLPDWQDIADVIDAGALANVLVWNEKGCLTDDCVGVDDPCDCCTGVDAGCNASTYTLSGSLTARSDCDSFGAGGTIQVWSNGIMQKCVASAPGVNEFAYNAGVITPNAASSVMYITFEQ